jgi:hypothetical protein
MATTASVSYRKIGRKACAVSLCRANAETL